MADLSDFAYAGQGFLGSSMGLLPFFQREQSIDIARDRNRIADERHEELARLRREQHGQQVIDAIVKQAKEEAFGKAYEGHAAGTVPVEQARAAAIRAGRTDLDKLFPGWTAAQKKRAETELGEQYYDPEPGPPPIREDISYEQGVEDENITDFLPADMAPKRRRFRDVWAEAATQQAAAKVTPEQRERESRLAAAQAERERAAAARDERAERREARADTREERMASQYGQDLDLRKREYDLRAREVTRKETKDKEARARIEATLKTAEALIVDVAKKEFPGSPQMQLSFTIRMRNTLRGLAAMDWAEMDMGQINEAIAKEMRVLRGEMERETKKPETKSGVRQWFSDFFSGLAPAIPGVGSVPPKAGTPAEAPAPEQSAGRAMPGRTPFQEQRRGERQTIFATMPPAAQYPGKTGRDTTTGKRYRSNGTRWIEIP